ncbi:MAG: glycosyltransferase family 4 protein [Candidatus Kryptoniota bacterium]
MIKDDPDKAMIIVYNEATTVGGVTNAISISLMKVSREKEIKLICRRKGDILEWCNGLLNSNISCQATALRNYLDIFGWFDIRNLFSIIRTARKAKVVHFHLHTPFSCLPAIFAVALFTSARIITTEHYVTQIRFLRRRKLSVFMSLLREIKIGFQLLIKKLSFKFIWKVIAVSESNHEFIISYFGDSLKAKTETILNGIQGDQYIIRKGQNKLNKDRKLNIVTIAGLNNQKGHEYLLRAVPDVIRAVPDAHFLLVGDGHLRSLLQEMARALKIERSVEFLGWRTDIQEILAESEIFVLPSLFEGLPLSLLEAMASGKAVVATAVDGTIDVVVDGVTGFLVPPANPSKMAEKIIELLCNPHLREKFGKEGQARVLSLFTAEKMSMAYLGLYKRAIQEI